jgi:hypothetical protein
MQQQAIVSTRLQLDQYDSKAARMKAAEAVADALAERLVQLIDESGLWRDNEPELRFTACSFDLAEPKVSCRH